jgi:hypothetical protein
VIDDHFDDLAKATCTRRATQLLGRARATHYRRRQLPTLGPPSPRPAPPNALSEPERQAIDCDYFTRRNNPDRHRDRLIEQLHGLGYQVTLNRVT